MCELPSGLFTRYLYFDFSLFYFVLSLYAPSGHFLDNYIKNVNTGNFSAMDIEYI